MKYKKNTGRPEKAQTDRRRALNCKVHPNVKRFFEQQATLNPGRTIDILISDKYAIDISETES